MREDAVEVTTLDRIGGHLVFVGVHVASGAYAVVRAADTAASPLTVLRLLRRGYCGASVAGVLIVARRMFTSRHGAHVGQAVRLAA